MAPLGLQDCHIDIKEEDVSDLMVEEGFCHEAEAIMRVETFKRCLLHVSPAHPCRSNECDISCALWLGAMVKSFHSVPLHSYNLQGMNEE